jgi:hypothetical protein
MYGFSAPATTPQPFTRPTRPTASSFDQTWRDGVYNGPRKRRGVRRVAAQ